MGTARVFTRTFNILGIFSNDLKVMMDGTFTKFAEDTKLWRPLDILRKRMDIQRYMDRLEEGVNKNPMKYDRDKYQALCWERKSPLQHYRLVLECRRSRSVERSSWGIDKNQQHAMSTLTTNSITEYQQDHNH